MADTDKSGHRDTKDDRIHSPRRVERISIDNSFKIVQLATDFSKNGKEIIRVAEEDKKSNFSKLTKMVKKIVTSTMLSKLMKPNSTEIDRRRQSSLQEFVYITEKLKQRVINSKEQDSRMVEDIKQSIQEGHMILAAVILNEMHTIISMYESDNSTISRPNLVRLLCDVKNYCDTVNTMNFPAEWVNIIQELSKKVPGSGMITTTISTGSKKKSSPRRGASVSKTEDEGEKRIQSHVKALDDPVSGSDKEDSDKEDTDEDGNETHTVQIEIRGNTGGFVGSTIEFDLVVTHEDGSPVKVQASDFGVEIHGTAANVPVNITAKGKEEDGAFRIEFVPKEPGANTLSIYMHNTLLTSGIKSIISKAGEIAFLIHSKDISRGQLQGISVIPVPGSKSQSKAEALKQKLEDIATAVELLEALRAKTLAEIDTLTNINT